MTFSTWIYKTGGPRTAMAAGLSVIAVLAILAIVLFLPRHNQAFFSLSGVSATTTATVRYEGDGQKLSLTALQDHSSSIDYAAPKEQKGDYRITATLQDEAKYKDLQILVNRHTNDVTIIASGFDPDQHVKLTSNDALLFNGLKFDWSGKIELQTTLLPKTASTLCFTAKPDFTMCHTLPKGVSA